MPTKRLCSYIQGLFWLACSSRSVKMYAFLANCCVSGHGRDEHRERDQPWAGKCQQVDQIKRRCWKGLYSLKLAFVAGGVFGRKTVCCRQLYDVFDFGLNLFSVGEITHIHKKNFGDRIFFFLDLEAIDTTDAIGPAYNKRTVRSDVHFQENEYFCASPPSFNTTWRAMGEFSWLFQCHLGWHFLQSWGTRLIRHFRRPLNTLQ